MAHDPPLEEAALLSVRPGDRIDDPDTATWGDGWIREGEIIRTQTGGRTLLLVPLSWPGNAAGLAILRESQSGACLVNVWAFAFGGNGIDLRAIDVAPVRPTEIRIRLDLVGHHRGYFGVPGDEATFVEPADAPTERVIATNGERAWLLAHD